jgi:hypothetical protein
MNRYIFAATAALFMVLAVLKTGAAEAQTITAPAYIQPGTYTVTSPGYNVTLYERAGISGDWIQLTRDANGSVQVTHGEGEYYYVAIAWNYYCELWYCYTEPGPSTSTVTLVSAGPTPSQYPVSQQMQYTYAVRQGDLDSDGRTDFYLYRTAGGIAGDGAIVKLILMQNADQTYSAIVPSSGQIATASAWATSSVQVKLDDFNADGFVDVILKGVGSVVSGASDQLVFAPGKIFAGAPQAVTALDASVQTFLSDYRKWVQNPGYFKQNAPIITYTIYYAYTWCDPWSYPSFGFGNPADGYGGFLTCYSYPIPIEYSYQDFSIFSAEAVSVSGGFVNVNGSGNVTVNVVPGSDASKRVSDAFKKVFGTDILRGVLRSGCQGGVLAYDGETTIDCTNQDLMGSIYLGTIHRVVNETSLLIDLGCRYASPGEIGIATGQNLNVRNFSTVKLCPFGWLGLFSGLVMTPDGNVYVGSNNQSGLLWSTDYSQGTAAQYSIVLHEFVHSYQVRNLGYGLPTMFAKELASLAGAGYVYYSNGSFLNSNWYQNNIEQQAQSLQDRYRLSRNPPLTPAGGINQNVSLPQLQGFVPSSLN